MYQTNLVSCGFSQVPGVNFSKNYSPVADNVTFHILLLMVIHFGFLTKIVNVDTAFLYGDIQEKKSLWNFPQSCWM